jgi:hypothetical protein
MANQLGYDIVTSTFLLNNLVPSLPEKDRHMRIALILTMFGVISIPSAWAQSFQTDEVKRFHKAASSVIEKNAGDLDNTVSDDWVKKFNKLTGKSEKKLTYRQVLSGTEQILQESATTVKVVATAAPKSCPVKYRPIAGGGSLDFGTTTATRNLPPATYEFTCQCTEKNATKRIMECTEDTHVDFECKR